MAGSVHIGTSGWHYKHWRGLFYPENFPAHEMLAFYARHFDTVELNNTFYQLPALSTFDSWRDGSPAHFLFAVKGSRFITHMKKLKDPLSSTKKFFAGGERLRTKLGPILFQLPPRWHLDQQRLAEFLEALPKEHRYAFEFRDQSWHVPEVYQLLHRKNAAFCIYDFSGTPAPIEITARFTYLRFHGARYSGSYSARELRAWAVRIRKWREERLDVYVYFNNDIGGQAITNAQQLKQMLEA
jgi:uncharacterized protein YecE (DUF72 family)